MSLQRATKAGNLSQAFLAKAASDPTGALATMFLAAFGVSLGSLMRIAEDIIKTKKNGVMMLAFTAGVQIRAHVVFVGRDFEGIRQDYPELIVEGPRNTGDIYNFGALHALGHVLAHVTNNSLGERVLAKAGSCITGAYANDSEAGKINKEISAGWMAIEVQEFSAFVGRMKAVASENLDPFMVSVPVLARNFNGVGTATTGSVAPVVATRPAKGT
jgi:hypothetical protein